MKRITPLVFILAVVPAGAQAPGPSPTTQPTRFTVAAAPLLFQPKGEFRSNVADGFGGGGALLYHLDLRFRIPFNSTNPCPRFLC